MSWLRARSGGGLTVGLGLHAEGVSIAQVEKLGDAPPRLRHCAFYPAVGEQAQTAELARLNRELKLGGTPVVVVLEPGDYTLLQVEAPNVEEEEQREAVRWRIKDLVEFPVEDAVLELFPMPHSQRAGAPRLISVVAAPKTRVQRVVTQLEASRLAFDTIDISELALRNLLFCGSQGEPLQALLYLAPRFGMIEIVRGSTLYLNRKIDINAQDLQHQQQGGVGLNDMMDALVLELQRSLDYQESQFGQGPVSNVFINGWSGPTEQLIDFAGENLSASVGALRVGDRMAGMEAIPQEQVDRCLPAIGAALRGD
jgi:MSHA biogenesis protein MshI